jgi:transposase
MLTPGYGLWEALIFKAVSESILFSVKQAAELNNVSKTTIYNWRKALEIN